MTNVIKINKEIDKLKERVLKLQAIEPKNGVEQRGIALNLRTIASKIVNLEEKKRYGR